MPALHVCATSVCSLKGKCTCSSSSASSQAGGGHLREATAAVTPQHSNVLPHQEVLAIPTPHICYQRPRGQALNELPHLSHPHGKSHCGLHNVHLGCKSCNAHHLYALNNGFRHGHSPALYACSSEQGISRTTNSCCDQGIQCTGTGLH